MRTPVDGSAPADSAACREIRLKRVSLRSWRRGMRENDLLLGRFADQELRGMNDAELTLYEALLEENDQDLYAWIVAATAGEESAPAPFRGLVRQIAAVAATRLR